MFQFIAGLIVGGFIGIFVAACCNAASKKRSVRGKTLWKQLENIIKD